MSSAFAPDPLGPEYESQLLVELIDENPDNPRRDLGDLTELADSIRAQGILEPLVVEPHEEDRDRYVVLAGHRRLAAARRAGLTAVPALVHPEPSPRHVRMERMLTENLQREDLTPIEEGDAFQMLLELPDADLTPTTLAKRLGRSKKYVTDRTKIAGLPEATRERILHGQVTLEDAARIEPFAKQPEVLERINRAAEAGPVALDRAIVEEQKAAAEAKERASVKRELRKQGLRVVDDGSDEWHAARSLAGVMYEWLKADDPRLPEGYADMDHDAQMQAERDVIAAQHLADHPDAHIVSTDVDYKGRVRVWAKCTDRSWHDENGPERSETPEQRAARVAEEEARTAREHQVAERRRKLEAAAIARRHFLGQVVFSDAADKLAREIALANLEPVFPSSQHTDAIESLRAFAHVVLPNLTATSLDDITGLKKKVRAALERLSTAQLVVLNDIRLNLHSDRALERIEPYIWSLEHYTQYRTRLRDFYGYEPSDIETEMETLHTTDEQETR